MIRPPACCLPSGLSPSVPEFHRVSRPLAADGSRTFTAGSEFHRPRSTPFTPISSVPYEVFRAPSGRGRAELVADAVLGHQVLAVARAELAPDPAHVHVHGAAVLRHRPAVRAEVAVPDPLDEVGAGEHGGRVRGEEGQQLEFLEGELDLVSVDPDAALEVIQAQRGTRLLLPARLAAGG